MSRIISKIIIKFCLIVNVHWWTEINFWLVPSAVLACHKIIDTPQYCSSFSGKIKFSILKKDQYKLTHKRFA